MSRKQFMRWEKLRMKGKKHVVMRSAILWGIFSFILLNLINWLWNGFSLPSTFLVIYPVIGFLAGSFQWSLNERRFEAFLLAKKANSLSNRSK